MQPQTGDVVTPPPPRPSERLRRSVIHPSTAKGRKGKVFEPVDLLSTEKTRASAKVFEGSDRKERSEELVRKLKLSVRFAPWTFGGQVRGRRCVDRGRGLGPRAGVEEVRPKEGRVARVGTSSDRLK